MTTKKRRAAEAALEEWHSARLAEDELRAALGDDPDDAAAEAMRKATAETAAKGKAWDEARTAAAVESETRQGDPDQVELRAAAARYNPGRIIQSMRGGRLDGVEAEINQHYGCAGNQIPLAIWDAAAEMRQTEDRAATPAPSGAENVWGVTPAIFAGSDAGFLGVDMPMVPSGAHSELVITGNLTAGGAAKGAAQAAAAATLAARTTTPKRISAALELTAEDMAIAGTEQFSAALRENLQLVMGDALNKALIREAPTNSNLPDGLLKSITKPSASVPANAAPQFADWWNLIVQGVDGVFARSRMDLRTLITPSALNVAAGIYRTDDAPEDLGRMLESQTGGLRASVHLNPVDGTTKASDAIQVRGGMAGMPTPSRLAAMPVWDRIELEDRWTQAAAATTGFFSHLLIGSVILLQNQAFRRLLIREAA